MLSEGKRDIMSTFAAENDAAANERHHEHGEHHHEHGEHQHSKHHKHSRDGKTKEKIKRFFSKHKSEIKGAAVTFAAVAFVAGCAWILDNPDNSSEPAADSETGKPGSVQDEYIYNEGMIYIGVPILDDEFVLIDRSVLDYVRSTEEMSISSIIAVNEEKRFDEGLPVKLSFDIGNIPQGVTFKRATLEISESKNFDGAAIYQLDDSFTVNIYNLKTGWQYSYRLSVYFSGKEKMDFCGTFRTADTPRILTIDGIRNVRDIGGWKTTDGKEIKQGLFYRGTELDGVIDSNFKLTEKGRNEMTGTLGIRTDMDLRSPENRAPGSYILGANVEHIYYNAAMYKEIFTESGKSAMKAIFSDLAKPEKYPVYLHCTYGQDRTGTVCYILEALLGVNEADIIKDYELTGFMGTECSKKNLTELKEELEKYSGESLQEKAEDYLLSIGVTPEEIASIKNIFLE